MAGEVAPAGHAVKLGFVLQSHAAMPRQRFDKVGTGVVAGAPVFATGVAQADNQFDRCQCGSSGRMAQRGI